MSLAMKATLPNSTMARSKSWEVISPSLSVSNMANTLEAPSSGLVSYCFKRQRVYHCHHCTESALTRVITAKKSSKSSFPFPLELAVAIYEREREQISPLVPFTWHFHYLTIQLFLCYLDFGLTIDFSKCSSIHAMPMGVSIVAGSELIDFDVGDTSL